MEVTATAALKPPLVLIKDPMQFFHEATPPYYQAHSDDIHAAVWHSPGVFMSGSKDNTLKIWDVNERGEIRPLDNLRRTGDYLSWITALTVNSIGEVLYGTRDGEIGSISPENQIQLQLDQVGKGGVICKERNMRRVTTVYSMHHHNDRFANLALIGRPQELICADSHDLSLKWRAKMHVNDWVYCVLPLRDTSVSEILTCVVMGSTLDIFIINFGHAAQKVRNHARVWTEDRKTVPHGHNRALIAHLERLHKTNPAWVAGACFDGTVRLFDIEHCAIAAEIGGHEGRCWQSAEFGTNGLLTCADDGLLRLWDVRSISGEATLKCDRQQ